MGLWPQWRSPLVWDVFAVSTYATVSLLFWYVGLMPDLATLARPGEEPIGPVSSTGSWRWAGAARPGTGTATGRPTCCWPAWRPRWSCRSTRSSRSTSPSRIVPGWHSHDLPPLLRGRGDLLGLRDGPDPGDPAAGRLRPGGFHHRPPPRQHGQGHAGHRPDRGLRLPDGNLHGLVQPESLRGVRDAPESAAGPLRTYVLDDDDM